MSNWSLGPGLTSQIGPFKTHKDDLPKVRKFPWKGGGVPAGGQGHAGHGNYMQTMNPEIFPMGMKPHHSNNYKSIVTIFDINNVSKKSSPMRMKRQTILGRPDEQETNQKMSMGLVDRQHQVPFEQQDKLEEEAEGIKPVQEETPQQVSNQQLFGTGKFKDTGFDFWGQDKYLTPPESRRDSINYDFSLQPQYSNHKEHVVSKNMEYKPIEMKEYAHEYLQKDQYNLQPDLSVHASDHRKVEYEMPRLMASDIYTTGALGTEFTSETLTVNEGGDELTPFKPQQIIMDAPKPSRRKSSIDSKRTSISRMDDSTPRTSVPEIKSTISHVKSQKVVGLAKPKAGIKRKQPPDTNKKPQKSRKTGDNAVKRLASQANQEAQTSSRAKKVKIDRSAYNHELKKKALESINTTSVGKARLAAAQSLAKGKQAAADAKILRGKALTSMAKNKTDKALRGHALTSMAKARTAKVYRELAVESMAKNKRAKALASKKNKKPKSAPASPRVSTSERPSKKTRAKANKPRRKST